LLGVYFTALFTRRGSSASVIWALATGFAAILVQQDYVVDWLGLPPGWKMLAFPYQLTIGTAVAFLTCVAARGGRQDHPQPLHEVVEASAR
ncbi:MAG: sodium:solute symporter, partial [Alphaproteobacteria bacterium]|nr:sodium:solute symporter [Alphaproteobacteria bacterium]